jgi:hypothetical protein
MMTNFPVSIINYYGIDPSPLKFVYFNDTEYLRAANLQVNYHLIDRAVVFDNCAKWVTLKYGEDNFGNFNVAGSNYARKLSTMQSNFEYVEINVETIKFVEVLELIKKNIDGNAIIIKIDCKNRTDYMFTECLKLLSGRNLDYLLSCEQDGSSDSDVSEYASKEAQVLSASNVTRPRRKHPTSEPTTIPSGLARTYG